MSMTKKRIAVYTTGLGSGGVGRMRVHLIREWIRRGHSVDLVMASAGSPMEGLIPGEAHVQVIGTSHRWMSIPRLVAYLVRRRPDVLLTDRTRLNASALTAVRWGGGTTGVYTSIHLPQGQKLERMRPAKRISEEKAIRRLLPKNKKIIAVSKGVADDLVRRFGIPEDRVEVIYNPVVVPDIHELAAAVPAAPLFDEAPDPLIMAAGRMTAQKDFPTLVRAFAILAERRPCRLAILGDGEKKRALLAMVGRLGLKDRIQLPGYVTNPYQYMAQADVFVLSSAWEGFGNVVAEAMALGIPVVSTDCPYGPREILMDGALGPLVPIGDPEALADAIDGVLARPMDPGRLKAAAQRFTVERCASRFLEVFAMAHQG
jgi:glycosyltransferase involved in cell wall biosynthesis